MGSRGSSVQLSKKLLTILQANEQRAAVFMDMVTDTSFGEN